nr:substrate-binding domain-containing protein [Streptomyces halstedii]
MSSGPGWPTTSGTRPRRRLPPCRRRPCHAAPAGASRPPEGVFCFADALAEGALHTLREHGLGVPADIAVVGFDDVDEARYAAPPLTTVAPDKAELARLALTALLDRMRRPESRTGTPPILLAGHRLVVRATT